MIRDLERRTQAMRHDLAHVDATLKMFAPGSDLADIKPLRPYRSRNSVFAKKELSTRVMNALRESPEGSATLLSIVERIMGEKGLEAARGHSIRGVVAIALKRLERRGIITIGEGMRWTVAP